jgi:hypothetical protein
VLGVLLPAGAPLALALTPLLSLFNFRPIWDYALELPSPIVVLPLSCSFLHLTIQEIGKDVHTITQLTCLSKRRRSGILWKERLTYLSSTKSFQTETNETTNNYNTMQW